MSYSDYRLCDVCGEKAFYDAGLWYHEKESDGDAPYRIAGKEQYNDPELNKKKAMCVDRVGDWSVLCVNCAKTHKTQIVEIEKQ